ncbi:MAG: lysylphosphatidylglycerol synthase domain-containing protein [Halobacteriaceae archaeon]
MATLATLALAVTVIGFPSRLSRTVLALAALGRGTLGRLSETVAQSLSREAVLARTGRFYATLDVMLDRPVTVLTSFALSILGWLFALLPLYLSLQAVGASVTLALIALVVPVAGLAGITPPPGGTGGIEVATVALLALLGGGDIGRLGAAALSPAWLPSGLRWLSLAPSPSHCRPCRLSRRASSDPD